MISVAILTILLAFMDISGLPCSLFVNIQIADIQPMYFTLMANFVFIGIFAYLYVKCLCPDWHFGFTTNGLMRGLKQYGIPGILIAILGFFAVYVGLMPFDLQPSLAKVAVEGVVYYIGVAIVEELYVRGLLLNLIEKLFSKSKHGTCLAIICSSVIFGLGHIPGVLGQSASVIVSKVVWTVGMGLYFGMIYKMTDNLWLPILIHFVINVCAIPYCFSSAHGYANLTLAILVPAYFLLGIYSLWQMKERNREGQDD